jgi:large subunit ribosomal protein L3
MIRGLLGRKLGMTRVFDKDGIVIPVTVVEAGPCSILEVKEGSKKKITLGFEEIKANRLKKPQEGLFKKAGVKSLRVIKEFDSQDNAEYEVGQEIKVDIFKPGDFIDVSAVSQGKGFQGGMKRWNWDGGPAGHGSHHHRRVGSIGACATPSRTVKGMHMPGQMGNERVTVQGLRVIDVDAENNIILVKGAVPGAKNSLIELNRSNKKAYKSLDDKPAHVVIKRNPMKQSKSKAKGK